MRWIIRGVGLLLVLLIAGGTLAVYAGWDHLLYRDLVYAVVARRVTRGAPDQQTALEQLNRFVYLNVREPQPLPLVDDSAADVLIRGFGSCDQAAWALTELAGEIGVPGRLLFLQDSNGTSPSSEAELYFDNEWRVFDPFYGWIPRLADGQVATAQDVANDPSLVNFSALNGAWYQHAQPVAVVDSNASWRRRLVATAADALASLPDGVVDRIQDGYLRLPPPQYVESDGQVFDDYRAPGHRLFFEARNYHLFGRTQDAVRTYLQVAAQYPNSSDADDAIYEVGQLSLSTQVDPRGAIRNLDQLQREYPDTNWMTQAKFLEAWAYDLMGECSDARPLYQAVEDVGRETNGAARAELRLQTLSCGTRTNQSG
ncbi:MAG: tetratricopeptide repeat protein [Chloroflexi bacterium]|nr:tetratricopeptide repeat protein [Chloroflexota bacterium]